MITLTKEQLDRVTGVHGAYVKLSNTMGIKVIHSKPFRTQAKAYRSQAYKLAVRESYNLQVAYDSGVVPRCYGIMLVKTKAGYRVGVLMQHLGATPLAKSDFYDSHEVFDDLTERLKEVGIYHADLHEDNIMVYRGKFYAVDFSPQSIDYK